MATRTQIALVALAFATPALAAEPGPSREDEAAARGLVQAWGMAYGGYVGGTTGYLVGETLEESEDAHTIQGVIPGVLVGGTGGLVTGLLLGPQLDFDLDEATWLWTTSATGTFFGVQLGRTFIPPTADGSVERVHAAGLAGSMAGTGIAFLTDAPDARAQLHFDLATGIGSLAAAGVADAADLYNPDDQQVRAGMNLVGSIGFGAIGATYGAWGREQPNGGAWGLNLAHGAWIGGMSPYLFTHQPTGRQLLGGMRAGLGVGYAGALLTAAVGNPSPKSVALQAVGIGAGSSLGAGIPMAIGADRRPRDVVAPMLASGVAGQVLGAAVAPHYELSDNDAFLLATLGAWTGYQAVGWSTWATATESEPRQALGTALTTGGAGTLLALAVAPAIDVPASGSAMLLSSGGWGTWYGGWSARLLNLDADRAWLLMLSSGDIGLAGTAVAEGAGWTPTWRQVGVVDGMGLLGAAGGGLIGVIALYDDDNWNPMVGSILVGSTVGLGVGIAMASSTSKGSDVGYDLPELRVGGSRWAPRVAARPWMDEQGQPGVWAEVSLNEL